MDKKQKTNTPISALMTGYTVLGVATLVLVPLLLLYVGMVAHLARWCVAAVHALRGVGG